jgi:hypothetical protein
MEVLNGAAAGSKSEIELIKFGWHIDKSIRMPGIKLSSELIFRASLPGEHESHRKNSRVVEV